MRQIDMITLVLLIVGGLNWLLVGLFQFDFVAALFGGQSAGLARIVYGLVGICALVQLARLPAVLGTLSRDDHPSSVHSASALPVGRRPGDGM